MTSRVQILVWVLWKLPHCQFLLFVPCLSLLLILFYFFKLLQHKSSKIDEIGGTIKVAGWRWHVDVACLIFVLRCSIDNLEGLILPLSSFMRYKLYLLVLFSLSSFVFLFLKQKRNMEYFIKRSRREYNGGRTRSPPKECNIIKQTQVKWNL